jgi:hypothetical protein
MISCLHDIVFMQTGKLALSYDYHMILYRIVSHIILILTSLLISDNGGLSQHTSIYKSLPALLANMVEDYEDPVRQKEARAQNWGVPGLLGARVRVTDSSITGAGRGVVVTQRVEQGELLTKCVGQVFTPETAPRSKYMVESEDGQCIIACIGRPLTEGAGVGMYVNSAHNTRQPANDKFVWCRSKSGDLVGRHRPRCYLEALCEILPDSKGRNSELLVANYGKGYTQTWG